MKRWVWFVIIFVALLFVYLLRPMFHDLIMLFYTQPFVLVAMIAIGFGVYFAIMHTFRSAIILFGVAAVCMLFAGLTPLLTQVYIVGGTDYIKINQMYESNSARVVPMAVAQRYGFDSLQKSKEMLGDFDPILVNNSQYWASPRVPNGNFLYFINKVQGVLLVDAQSPSRSTQLVNERFAIGEQMGIFDNIYWNLYYKRFLVDVAEVFYVHDGEQWVTVAPYISYRFVFPVMLPTFGGVFVVTPDGEITDYTPEQVKEIDYLTRVYPEQLARLVVESYQYKKGVFNAWFIHDDQTELADLPGQNNRQPFLMDTKSGLKWVVATEPFGQSYGVFKIFFVDAKTGGVDVYELNENKTLTGPVKVVSYVRSAYPNLDWSAQTVIEPRPYVINETLYWMLSVTPRDYAGISKTVLVNADNNNVEEFATKEEIVSAVVNQNATLDKELIRQKIIEIEAGLDELKTLLEE